MLIPQELQLSPNKLVAMKSHVIHFFHPAKDKVNSPADKQDQKKS